MSTSCTITFKDGPNECTIYQHHDGDRKTIRQYLKKTKKFAWKFPRFEAEEFASAYIAANKPKGGGHLYCIQDRQPTLDVSFEYIITVVDGKFVIK